MPVETQGRMYGTTHRLQEEETTEGSFFAPSDPGRSSRQLPCFEDHRYNECGYGNAPTRSKEEDLTKRLSP